MGREDKSDTGVGCWRSRAALDGIKREEGKGLGEELGRKKARSCLFIYVYNYT